MNRIEQLHHLAETLVTPERFKATRDLGQTVVSLTPNLDYLRALPHLPENKFLAERESQYHLDTPEPPLAA